MHSHVTNVGAQVAMAFFGERTGGSKACPKWLHWTQVHQFRHIGDEDHNGHETNVQTEHEEVANGFQSSGELGTSTEVTPADVTGLWGC